MALGKNSGMTCGVVTWPTRKLVDYRKLLIKTFINVLYSSTILKLNF